MISSEDYDKLTVEQAKALVDSAAMESETCFLCRLITEKDWPTIQGEPLFPRESRKVHLLLHHGHMASGDN